MFFILHTHTHTHPHPHPHAYALIHIHLACAWKRVEVQPLLTRVFQHKLHHTFCNRDNFRVSFAVPKSL